ncbi:single-stranded DNA-binding protein [Candidatus Gracilibacteria bacterium]|nr:single-stranded DNA-binding protein [Candidatus Gracilibacteria bacterium]
MAASLNSAQIIGNITRDPEVRQTPNGQTVATIGVATNRKWTNKQTNEKQEEVEFHNVVVWGKLAEICQQYLKKGAKVYFQGRLKTRNWEDPDGKKNYRTEVIAENMIMLDSRGAGSAAPAAAAAQPAAASSPAPAAQKAPPPTEEEVKIDDLPF